MDNCIARTDGFNDRKPRCRMRIGLLSPLSESFAVAFMSLRDRNDGLDVLSTYVDESMAINEKLAVLTLCTSHDDGWFATRAAWGLAETVFRTLRHSTRDHMNSRLCIATLREGIRHCRSRPARNFLRMTLAFLGCASECKRVAARFDELDYHQKDFFLRILGRLRNRCARRALVGIALKGKDAWARVTAATTLTFHYYVIGRAILQKLVTVVESDPCEQCRVFFALAWAGQHEGIEGIERHIMRGSDEKAKRLLCRLCERYGVTRGESRRYFERILVECQRYFE